MIVVGWGGPLQVVAAAAAAWKDKGWGTKAGLEEEEEEPPLLRLLRHRFPLPTSKERRRAKQ